MRGDATRTRAIATAQRALSKISTALNSRHACVFLLAMLLDALRRFHSVSEAQALLEAKQYTAAAREAQAEQQKAVA